MRTKEANGVINNLSYGVILMIVVMVAFIIWGHTGDRRAPGAKSRKPKPHARKGSDHVG